MSTEQYSDHQELLSRGFRFYCDPDQPKGECKWLHPKDAAESFHGWIDTTDMTDEEFDNLVNAFPGVKI